MPKCIIKAKDPHLHRINVAALGFLTTSPVPDGVHITTPILEGIPKVGASSSHPVIKEEKEEKEEEEERIVEVSNSKDDIDVFNQPLSPEAPVGDLGDPFPVQTDHAQEEAAIPADMGIQRKQRTGLLEVMESSVGCKAPEKPSQAKLPPLPPIQPANHKRKREQRGQEVVEGGKGPQTKKTVTPKGAKQPKVTQTQADKRGESSMAVPAWTPAMILDGALLLANASIRNFQGGAAGYVADATEQALLLLADMADLREMRKHEVFLSLKKDLALVSSMNISLFLSP